MVGGPASPGPLEGGSHLGLVEGVPGSGQTKSSSWTIHRRLHSQYSIYSTHLLGAYCVPGHVLGGTGTQQGPRQTRPALTEPTVSPVEETDKEPNKHTFECQVVISAMERCREVESDGGVATLSTVARGGLSEKVTFHSTM